MIWIETPSNPCLKISDIAGIAKLAHSRRDTDIIFVVDNTLLTSYFQRPLELQADVVMYSLTKYMNGHNDVLAGALVVNDTKLYEELKLIQVNHGLTCSPFDCYLINRGLKTLSLRMKQHFENGLAVAKFLEAHPKVLKVSHPWLPSHSQHELAKSQSSGHCGLIVIQLDGTVEEAKKFILNLRIFLSSDSLGSFTSFCVLPYAFVYFKKFLDLICSFFHFVFNLFSISVHSPVISMFRRNCEKNLEYSIQLFVYQSVLKISETLLVIWIKH